MSTPLSSQYIFTSDYSRRSKPIKNQRVRSGKNIAPRDVMGTLPNQTVVHSHRPRPQGAPSPKQSMHLHQTSEHTSNVGAKGALKEKIDFSQLGNFEVVGPQYEQQGIQFQNAIALHPSNPAFPSCNGNAIILGGPKSGTLDIWFSPPVHTVESSVTSSGVTVMTAFDDNGQIIATDETLGRNLDDEHSDHAPHVRLSVHLANRQEVHHVRLRCGGGHVSLSELGFSRIGH